MGQWNEKENGERLCFCFWRKDESAEKYFKRRLAAQFAVTLGKNLLSQFFSLFPQSFWTVCFTESAILKHLAVGIDNYVNKCLEVARRWKHCRESAFLEWEEGRCKGTQIRNLGIEQLLSKDPRVWGIRGFLVNVWWLILYLKKLSLWKLV